MWPWATSTVVSGVHWVGSKFRRWRPVAIGAPSGRSTPSCPKRSGRRAARLHRQVACSPRFWLRPAPASQFTDADLCDELKAFLVAGQTTTASALAWTWYALSERSAVRAQLEE